MIETMIAGFVTLLTIGFVFIVVAGIAVVLSVVILPFQLLGWLFKGLGLLIVLPFLLLLGTFCFLLFGFGALVLVIPLAPFLVLTYLLWRWMRGRTRATVSA